MGSLIKKLENNYGASSSQTNASKPSRLVTELDNTYITVPRPYSEDPLAAYKSLLNKAQSNYNQASAAYDETKKTVGAYGWWRRMLDRTNEQRQKEKDNPYLGWDTDQMTFDQMYGNTTPTESLAELFHKAQEDKKARKDANLEAKQAKDKAELELAAVQDEVRWQSALEKYGGSPTLVINGAAKDLRKARAAGDEKLVSQLENDLAFYENYRAGQKASAHDAQIKADFDKTQTGDTAFKNYTARLDQLGEQGVSAMQRQYEMLQEKASDEYAAEHELSLEQQEKNRQKLQAFEDANKAFLDQYGLYGTDIKYQGDAGVAEAQANLDAAKKHYEELTGGYEVLDPTQDPQYQETMREAEAFADEQRMTGAARKQYLAEQEEIALQDYQYRSSFGGDQRYYNATDEEIQAAAKAITDAETVLRHALELKDRDVDQAFNYSSVTGDPAAMDRAQSGLESYNEWIESLGGLPSEAAKADWDAQYQKFYDDAIDSGYDKEDAEAFAKYWADDWWNSQTAQSWRHGLASKGEEGGEYMHPERYRINDNWTEEEKLKLGWYWDEEDPSRAFEYARDVNAKYEKERRDEEKLARREHATRNAVTAILDTIGARGAIFTSWLDYISEAEEGYQNKGDILYTVNEGLSTYADDVQTAISEALSSYGTLNDLVSKAGIDADIPLIGDKGLDFAYQAFTSGMDSMLTLLASSGNAGLMNFLFFGATAEQELRDHVENDLVFDYKKAMDSSFWKGVGSAVAESLPLEYLGSLSPAEWLKKGVWALIGPRMSEQGEEVFEAYWDRYVDDRVYGKDSKYNREVIGYEAAGLSEKEAKAKADATFTKEVLDAAAAAWMSMGFTQAGYMGKAAIRNGAAFVGGAATKYQGDAGKMFDYAALLTGQNAADEKARNLADKYRGRYESKGNISNLQAGRMQEAIWNSLRGNVGTAVDSVAAVTDAVKQYFGSVADAKKAAENAASADEETQQNLLDLAGDLGMDTKQNQPGLQNEKQSPVQRAAERVRQAVSAIENIEQRRSEREARETRQKTVTKQDAAKFDENGGTITNARYNSSTGNVEFTITDSNGETRTVGIDQLKGDAAEAFQILEDSLGQQAAEAFNMMSDGQNVLYFATDFRSIRELGRQNGNLDEFLKTYDGILTDEQARAAYALGQGITKLDGGKPIRSARGTGRVTLDGGTLGGRKLAGVSNKEALKRSQDFKEVQALAKLLEIDVVFYESQTDSDRYYVGAQGAYHDGVIYLDVNAGLRRAGEGKRLYATVMSHELTHFIAQNASDQYQQLQDRVAQYLMMESGESLSELIRSKMARSGERMSYDEAMEEVVADACETMLVNSQYVQELAQNSPKLFKTIHHFVSRFTRQVIAGHSEAKALLPIAEEIQKIWDDALKTAVENRATTQADNPSEAVHDSTAATTNDATGTGMFSLRTYDESGRTMLSDFLSKRVKEGALTKEESQQIRTQIEELYKICDEYDDGNFAPFSAWSNAEVVTYDGRPVFSVVKANGEYKLNLDFSLVCKKRRTLDAVFNEMIAQGIMDDFDMVQESIAKINDIIRENGFETACGLCFVDSKRYRQGMIADAFVMMYNQQVFSLLQKGAGQKMDYFNYGGDQTIKNTGEGIDTLPDDELNWTTVDNILKTAKPSTVKWKIANYLKNNPSARKLVRRGDFMSTAGFDALKAKNPDLLSLYNSKKGAGGPKAAQSDVQYLNEIIESNSFNPKAAYEVGGVRIQSFSDYVGRLVFDYVQMTADLAAKKLPAHSYTKEYMFAEQFGLTGIKINMSLVPEIIQNGVAPGLDENGNYAWKDGQSFGSTVYDNNGKRLTAAEGFELAKKIQNAEGYSKNCGTIAVGVSDEHIQKMLDDPEIRMIIPYHKSSLNHIVAAMMNIDQYADYTLQQNTREWNGKKWVNIARSGEFNFNEALQRLGDAKAAAQEYLDWCKEKGYKPKFDQFAAHPNYYKLLEDYSCYDSDGTTNAPMGAVEMRFPGENDAFGSMKDLIKEGLEEDAILQAKQEKAVPEIVKQIQSVLPEFEGTVRERNQKKKKAAPKSDVKYAEREQSFDTDSETHKAYGSLIDSIVSAKGDFTEEQKEKKYKVRDDTPQVILDWDKTAKNLPIMIRYDAAYLATRHDGTIVGHYHDLGDVVMKELPAKLENPVLMLKLKNGRINSIIRLVDKNNRSVLVSVELNELDENRRPASHLVVTVMGASEGNIRNLIENRGAKVIYKTEEASHFIPGLNHTTGNDLDTSSDSRITQDDGVVKRSERDDSRTDRELLMESTGEKLTQSERQELEKYRTKLQDFEARERKVQAALEELDRMVKAKDPNVQKQRAKVSNLQAGMQKALRELTGAENSKAMQEIIRKEREIQRQRTRMATKETFTKRELRGRITKLYNDLNRRITNPTEKKNIPVPVMQQAIEVLEAINMDSSREGSKAGQALRDKLLNLQQKYAELKDDPDYRNAAVYDETVSEILENMIKTVGDTPINRMNATQMQAVYEALTALDKTARTALKIKMLGEERDAYEVAQKMGEETRSVKKPSKNLIAQWLNAQLSPERMFRRLGGYHKDSAWSQIYRMLDDGQLKATQIQMEAAQIFNGLLEGKNYEKFVNPKETVDIGLKGRDGKAIPITHGMMVALYMHLQNEQNAKHVARGGLTVPNLRDYYNGRNNRGLDSTLKAVGVSQEIGDLRDQLKTAESEQEKDAIRKQIREAEERGTQYIEDLRNAIESKLTDYDRKWIAAAKELFDEYSKGRLNEATMETYGIKRANVENYFPLSVNKDFLNTPFESIAKDMSLENAGFMKERVDSGKPIYLFDVSDVAKTQIRRVSQYAGIMPVVRNFNKVWGKVQTGYRSSLQDDVRDKFGTAGIQYVENLMADLNGARGGKEGPLADFFNALRGNMAQASLTLSLRTALAQTASYPTAASVVGWKALGKALAAGGKNSMPISRADQELIRKYSPLLWYRLRNGSTVELGDIKESNSATAKLWKKMRWATGWIQAMDGATVGRLWYAAEYYVQDQNKALKKGTDAYYQEVAKVFNDIVEKTQPNYTTMQRPDILRNPNALVRQLTMFLTQRLQNFNILYDSAATYSQMKQDVKTGRATQADVNEARKTVARAATSQLVAAATIAAFKFLADAILHSMNNYRDDDKELTEESISKELLDMFIDSLAGNVLGGGEVYDLIEKYAFNKTYYGIDVAGVSTVTDVVEAAQKFLDAALEEGATAQTIWNKGGHKLTQKIATLLGIPEANAEKIVKGLIWHTEDIVNGEFLSYEAGVDRTAAQEAHRLYRAYAAGNYGTANKIREQVGEENKDKLDTALKEYIKKQYADGKITKTEAQKQMEKFAGMRKDDAEKAIREYSCFVETGIKYSEIGEKYVAGDISASEAQKMLVKYGTRDSQEAAKRVKQLQCQKDTGIKYDEIDDDLRDGRISEAKAAQLWQTYGGMDATKAGSKAEWTVYEKNNPNTKFTSASFETYYKNYKPLGMTAKMYENFKTEWDAVKGTDKNHDGKADAYSKKKDRVKIINNLPLTNEQKDALYKMNWSSGLKDAPWH